MLIRAWGSMSEREERFWSGEITIKHPTSNIQHPEKFDEDPRSKIQDPEKIQYPTSKPDQRHGRRAIQHACSPGKQICLDLGAWSFPGSWILDLGSLCSLYGRFDNLNQSPDNLFNIHALSFCAIVEQDAMAQRGIGQGADVIQGHVR